MSDTAHWPVGGGASFLHGLKGDTLRRRGAALLLASFENMALIRCAMEMHWAS